MSAEGEVEAPAARCDRVTEHGGVDANMRDEEFYHVDNGRGARGAVDLSAGAGKAFVVVAGLTGVEKIADVVCPGGGAIGIELHGDLDLRRGY